jgi:hypothetical protein
MNKRLKAAGMKDMTVKLRPDGSLDAPPTAPRGVRALDAGAEGVTLLWNKARDDGAIRGYRVYRDGKLIARLKNDATWWVDPKGSTGAKYEIRAVDDSGSVGVAGTPGGGSSALKSGAKPGGPLDAAVAAKAPRTGAAPVLGGVKGAGPGMFELVWKATPDAIAYGVWDGDRLLGHVKATSFKGTLGAGNSAALRVDAVRKDGTRTPLTNVVGLRLGEQGIEVSKSDAAPGAAADPAGAAGQQQGGQQQGGQPSGGQAAPAPTETPASAAPASAPAAAPAGQAQAQQTAMNQAAAAASRMR